MDAPITMFIKDVDSRVTYWRDEADLTYAEVIGALELIKADLIQEMRDTVYDDDEPT